jgi:Nif-specific regulatory protein
MSPPTFDQVSRDVQAARNRAEMALGGVYEISMLLAAPNRLEPTLLGVLALLSSFLDMRHGLIALLAPRGAPELVVGSDWEHASAISFFQRLPEQAIGQIVVIPDIARDPPFSNAAVEEIRAPHGEGQFGDMRLCAQRF